MPIRRNSVKMSGYRATVAVAGTGFSGTLTSGTGSPAGAAAGDWAAATLGINLSFLFLPWNECLPLPCLDFPDMRHPPDLAWLFSSGVRFIVGATDVVRGQVGVDLGGGDVGVAQ